MLIRRPRNAYFLPHLSEVKRLNRFGRGKMKAKVPVKPKDPGEETDAVVSRR